MKPVNDKLVAQIEAEYQLFKKTGLTIKPANRCDICGKKRAAECYDGVYRCLRCIDRAFPEGTTSFANSYKTGD